MGRRLIIMMMMMRRRRRIMIMMSSHTEAVIWRPWPNLCIYQLESSLVPSGFLTPQFLQKM